MPADISQGNSSQELDDFVGTKFSCLFAIVDGN